MIRPLFLDGLRLLEIEVLQVLFRHGQRVFDIQHRSVVDVDAMYGIGIGNRLIDDGNGIERWCLWLGDCSPQESRDLERAGYSYRIIRSGELVASGRDGD